MTIDSNSGLSGLSGTHIPAAVGSTAGVATSLIADHRGATGALDAPALAAGVARQAGGDGDARAAIEAAVSAQLSPVESGEFAAALDAKAAAADSGERERIVMDGGSKGDWPPELNARDLQPNTDYVVNGYTYQTDAQGRVTSAEGQLDLKTADRNSYQQGVSGREDRLPDDQGGHLIASIFNGAGDRVNLVPMNGNFNMGAWRNMERGFEEALEAGKSVDVNIEVIYSGDSTRPDGFVINSEVGGVAQTDTFFNRPGGE